MKPSRYNILFDRNGMTYAFNAMTCALAEVDNDFIAVLRGMRNSSDGGSDSSLVDQMARDGFLIDDDLDEIQKLKLLNWSGKFSNYGLGLTIAPTLACNFACRYCYESRDNRLMSKDVQDAIVSLVSKRAQRNMPIGVTWYGGEPLLALGLIETLSQQIIEICEKTGAKYGSYIVTNAYLLTPEAASTLVKCHVRGAQVTIDGPREVHNSRRAPRSGGDSFDVILTNVKSALAQGISIDIRINVDRNNYASVPELLEVLRDEGLTCCNISFGHVNAYTEACADVETECIDMSDYAQKTIEYQKLLLDYGFRCDKYPLYPGTKANYCCADNASSFVVDPSGYVYKCWNDVGLREKSVGSVLRMDKPTAREQMNLCRYMLWSPFDFESCLHCKLLPICMGGCPFKGIRDGGKPECEKWKYNLQRTLDFIVDNEARITEQK